MDADAPVDLRLLPRSARLDASGRLSVGGCDLATLAAEHGTPLYVYDEGELRARCREYRAGFGDDAVAYAGKAFLCVAMARVAAEEGMHLDVASGGEAYVAARAGFPAARMVMHGNNKSEAELRATLEAGVGRIVVDSSDELDRIERLVAEGLPVPRVLVRVTPGVEAHTHDYIATGADDSKFGFTASTGAARGPRPSGRCAAMPCTSAGSTATSARRSSCSSPTSTPSRWWSRSRPRSRPRPGPRSTRSTWGVASASPTPQPTSTRRRSPSSPTSYAPRSPTRAPRSAWIPRPSLTVEAGRSIAGPAGLTLYTVGTIKEIPGVHTYVAVDGGMSDNPRPATYGARYEVFAPARAADRRPFVATLAGKHCEQGDVLVTDAHLPTGLAVGDVVATPVTGAYGHSMASNYNLLPRPAVVFVRDGEARVVVRRESPADLVSRDVCEGD